jgi:alkyldihydroxyacetonephosphate synthase
VTAGDAQQRLDRAVGDPFAAQDREHEGAWGFADTAFAADRSGIVRMSGSRYDLCGLELPDLLPFAARELGATVDPTDLFRGKPPATAAPSRCSEQALQRLAAVTAPDRVTTDPALRTRHGHGHTQEEVFRLNYGSLARVPDAVVYPTSETEVIALVQEASACQLCLIPFGGGTNVTQALTCPEQEPRPIVAVDMRRMNRILWIDRDSQTACIEAGAVGRHLLTALAKHGFTLGHEPDSIEFSTLGGWIATRASGMKKNRYGNVEDIVLDVRLITPQGTVGREARNPRESTGPNPKELALGSEGNLGIVTSAVVQLRPLPEVQRYGSVVFPDFSSGMAFLHALSRSGQVPASVRLVDNLQFRFGLALKPRSTGLRALKSQIEKVVITKLKGFDPLQLTACTVVFEGSADQVHNEERAFYALARTHRGIAAGAENGRRGYQLTYGIAYIRDFILKHYILAESFETSVPWSKAQAVIDAVHSRIKAEHARAKLPGKPFLSSRVTQLYPTGVCIYFYLAYYFKGVDNPPQIYSQLEHAAREAVLEAGGSLSHHHGVGKIRQDFMPQVHSPLTLQWVKSTKTLLDPQNIFGAGNHALGNTKR